MNHMMIENARVLNEAIKYSIRGEFDEAERILRSAKEPSPHVLFNLGWYDLMHGHFKKGFEGLNMGRWISVFGDPVQLHNIPLPRPTDSVDGKELLFHCEGGFGDEIANIRFVAPFIERGANVTIGCSKPLMKLFATKFSSCKFAERGKYDGMEFDYWVPAMSAPTVLDMEYENLSGKPYLHSPSWASDAWSNRVQEHRDGKHFNVAFKWSGNPQFEHEQHRLFPKEMMLDLAKDKRLKAWSLQKEFDDSGLPRLGMADFAQTASELSKIDLVITSCSSTAHLSGALGKETWVIVPTLPYYTWALPGDTSPWYDSVKLFRQTEYGSWEEPFERIATKLSEVLYRDV